MAESKEIDIIIQEINKQEHKDTRWLNCEPVPETDMTFVGSWYTVCEIMREIYNSSEDPDIRFKCRVACGMAKSMAGRITQHEGKKWGREQYPWNPKVSSVYRKAHKDDK